MSKTYEMWASDDFIKRLSMDRLEELGKMKGEYYKNKVTITFHKERKVTISEDEFDEIHKAAIGDSSYGEGLRVTALSILKEKLFNKQD